MTNFANGLKLYPCLLPQLPGAIRFSSSAGILTLMGTSGSLTGHDGTLRLQKILNVERDADTNFVRGPQFAAAMNVMSTPSTVAVASQLVFALAASIFIDHISELVLADFKWFLGARYCSWPWFGSVTGLEQPTSASGSRTAFVGAATGHCIRFDAGFRAFRSGWPLRYSDR